MKTCIYVTKSLSTGKWYVGSHKNSDNVRNKTYMGSGSGILQAIEEYGSGDFDTIVLKEFSDRNEAFKGEDQLLKYIDAAGNDQSYNRTNESWPKEGFFKNMFGKKQGPLSIMELNEFKNIIMERSDNPGPKDPITVQRLNTWSYTYGTDLKDLIKNIPAISEIGERAAYVDFSSKNFDIQLEHLIAKLEQAIEEEIFTKENELAHLEIVEDTDMTDHKVLVVNLKNEINKIKGEQSKVKKEQGYYKSIYRALHQGFSKGKENKTREMLNEHAWKQVK